MLEFLLFAVGALFFVAGGFLAGRRRASLPPPPAPPLRPVERPPAELPAPARRGVEAAARRYEEAIDAAEARGEGQKPPDLPKDATEEERRGRLRAISAARRRAEEEP